MADRSDCFSWSGMACGVASLVMFGFAQHEGRKAKQLQQAHPLPSISAVAKLANCLPVLVAARGTADSDEPVTGRISPIKSVLVEEVEESSALKQNEKGAWCPEFRVVKHNRTTKKWFISDDGGESRLGVHEAFEASLIENAMTSHKQFREGQASAYHRLMSRLSSDPLLPIRRSAVNVGCCVFSGYQPLGTWETERVLPVGTEVTVVGELARSPDDKDGMVVRKPTGPFAGHPYVVTPKSFGELQESLIRNTGTCKWLSIGFGTASVVLIGIQIWRHVRSTLRYRRIRKQLANGEKRRGERATQMSSSLADTSQDAEDRGKCIVCWDRPVDAVFIPCGHVCACQRCCLELNRCPICRKPCSVHKIYLA